MPLSESARQAVIGAGVFVAGGLILALSYSGGRHVRLPGYDVVARFDKADGIAKGSDVRLAGVSVGKVTGQSLDARFRAVVTLHLAPTVSLPLDSAAVIQTDGLLGAKFITLQPGGDDDLLKANGELTLTQGSMNLEDILSQVIAQAEAKRAEPRVTGGTAH